MDHVALVEKIRMPWSTNYHAQTDLLFGEVARYDRDFLKINVNAFCYEGNMTHLKSRVSMMVPIRNVAAYYKHEPDK